jgi:hypothetical protein
MARFDYRLFLVSLVALPLVAFTQGIQPALSAGPETQDSNASARDSATSAPADAAARNCPTKHLLFNYEDDRHSQVREIPIWQSGDGNVIFFTTGMTIDADGAPNAYNPDDTGLDELANAGAPGHWEGIVQDKDGNPFVQGPDDPYPGYYVSCTTLADWSKPLTDPTRFVDATRIPYIVLPGEMARSAGASPGDLAVVVNLRNGNYSYAIYADMGTLGEGSIALANNLGIPSDARYGGTPGGVLYLIFPGSGDHRPKSIDEIDQTARGLLADRGDVAQLSACARNTPRSARLTSDDVLRSDSQ